MPDNAKPGPELTVLVSPEPEPVMDPQPGLDSSPTRELADVSLRSSTEGSPESPNSELLQHTRSSFRTTSSDPPATQRGRTLWVKGLVPNDDGASVRSQLTGALPHLLEEGAIEKITVRKKEYSETKKGKAEDAMRLKAEREASKRSRGLTDWIPGMRPGSRGDTGVTATGSPLEVDERASWAFITFQNAAQAQLVCTQQDVLRTKLGWQAIAAQDPEKTFSAESKAVFLFHTYAADDRDELSFDEFRDFMVTEFDAEPEAIQTLWSLPGFCKRQQNLEQREVVSLESFRYHMQKLGLLERLLGCRENDGNELSDDDEDSEGELDTCCDRLCNLEQRMDRCAKKRLCCFFLCVKADGKVRLDHSYERGPKEPRNCCCLQPRKVLQILSPWDAWIVFLLFYVTATVPVRLGFDLLTHTPGQLALPWWFMFDLLTDVSFLMDVFIRFSSPYYEDDAWHADAHKVQAKYIFGEKYAQTKANGRGIGEFWIDLGSCLPSHVNYIFLIFVESRSSSNAELTKGIRILRLVRLTRLLQLFKLHTVLERNTENLREVDWLTIAKAAFGTLVGAHLMACGWHFVAIQSDDVYASWLSVYDNGTLLDSIETGEIWHRYVASFYFATTTLSTVVSTHNLVA